MDEKCISHHRHHPNSLNLPLRYLSFLIYMGTGKAFVHNMALKIKSNLLKLPILEKQLLKNCLMEQSVLYTAVDLEAFKLKFCLFSTFLTWNKHTRLR